MGFILYLAAGFAAGILGGMGMGGGTILIPVLTLLLGVNQHIAQAANVIAFLPMAAIVLPKHKKNGLLKTDGLWEVIIPAVIFAVLGSFIMAYMPADLLQKLFGIFLIALAVKQFFATVNEIKGKK